MPRVIWTPYVAAEFEDILFFIRINDNRPITAQRIGEQVVAELEKLAGGELQGHRHKQAPKSWLYFQFKRWLLFYQKIDGGIEVMRVLDGARDLPPQFLQNPG